MSDITVRDRAGYFNVLWGGEPPNHTHRIGTLNEADKDTLVALLERHLALLELLREIEWKHIPSVDLLNGHHVADERYCGEITPDQHAELMRLMEEE